MRRLVFERLALQRFRSFDEAVNLSFKKLGTGLHYLRGINKRAPRLDANGAGKSSLWDGLLWVLHGKTAQGLRNPDIAPWNGAKKTQGLLDFTINDKPYRIIRKANPNALTLNGRDVDQAAIDRLIGLSIPVLTNAVMFPQNRPLFFDLEPRHKLTLFDEVLRLDRWLNRSTAAGKKLEKRTKIAEAIEGDIASIEREQDTMEQLLTDLKNKSRSWEDERSTLIQTEQERMEQAKKRRAVLLKDRDGADLALDSAGTQLKFLRTDIKKAEHELHLYAERVNAAKIKEQVAKREIKVLKESLGMEGTCPTCLQPIRRTGEHRSHIRDKIADLERVVVPESLIEKTEKAREVAARLDKAKRAFEEKEIEARTMLDRVGPEVASLEATIQSAQRAMRQHENTQNPYGEQSADLRRRVGELKREQKACTEDLIVIRRKIERARFWVQGFKEVRLYVINDVLDELKIATDSVLDAMGLVGWEVRYSVEKEKKSGDVSRALHVTVLSPDNAKAVRWEVWSGGEAQRLRLAGSLALSEVLLNHAGITTNLEVLDEPSRGMSRGGISDLCDYLATRADRQGKVVVLTDHHALAAGRFRSTLTVTKDERGSYLEHR